MKTLHYIRKYELLERDILSPKMMDQLIEDLKIEFNAKLVIRLNASTNMGIKFDYDKFLTLVEELKVKYDSINNKKIGRPFPDNIWAKIYATVVIPARGEYFKEEHELANARREAWLLQREKELQENQS